MAICQIQITKKQLIVNFVVSRKDKKEWDTKKAKTYIIMNENEISYKVIGTSIEIHKTIGPGLLESAYENALAYDLSELGFYVKQQVPMPFIYKGVKQDVGYRLDLILNDKVIIEIKSIEELDPIHFTQTLTYLKLSGLKLALLINFNKKILKGNIHRIVNGL